MILADVIAAADRIAPPQLALEDDPIGLQTGDPAWEVSRACVCLDATASVLRHAERIGAQAVFSHHPLVYHPLRSLAETTPHVRLLAGFVRSKIALYSLHTNWDVAPDGLNDALGRALGLTEMAPLEITNRPKQYKLAVFVPEQSLDAVRVAMGDAGAGVIGNYSHCSFRAMGTGSFLPLAGAHPHIGAAGLPEEVDEWRLEVVVGEHVLQEALRAMLDAHPYEEVAYDVYELADPRPAFGIGRIGQLDHPTTFAELQKRISDALGNPPLRVRGEPSRTFRTLAVCGGSGGDLIEVAASRGAGAYVTGDVRHHQFLLADSLGLCLIDATHEATESLGMRHFAERLAAQAGPEVEVTFIPG